MPILDGMISNQAELDKAFAAGAPFAAEMLAKLDLNEKTRSVLDLMKEGLSLGDVIGITKEHRDALLVNAGRLMQAGEMGKARDALVVLYQLEPLDERTIYMLAATYQAQGDFATAAKLYVNFLALDATNPEGYLRLGECHLGARELKEADDCFRTAINIARSAGKPTAVEHARRMLEIVADSSATQA